MPVSTMKKSTIRRAGAADAKALAALGERTFAAAFGAMYPPEDLAAFVAETHSPAAVSALLADPNVALWLAERDGVAVAYALAGPCGLPHPEVTPGCGELKRIYVDASAQGEGLGGLLMDQALCWLQTSPRRRLWIGVWSGNLGAHRLYRRYGFEKVGEYSFVVGASRDQEFIFSRG
jgi:ribosomal protein S18 acetylase RimI-like enzyme